MGQSNGRGARVRPSGPPDPRVPGRWHKLYVVPRDGEHRVTALGESVTWVWRHWCNNRGRFELCLQGLGEPCLLCQHRFGREQSGYLPVVHGSEQVTMVITAGAWLNGRSLREADGSLRGRALKAFRLHPRANGPLRVWLPGDSVDGRRLPPAWDVLAELDVRFGLASRDDQAAEDLDGRPAV